MKAKDLLKVLAVVSAVYHAAAIVRDAERCKVNLDRFLMVPSADNLLRLTLATGVLLGDF